MIVKDEESCICECLESVKPIISSWVISDTGSSDKTEEVIKNCLKNIPGNYSHDKWQDFSTNRNIALNLARKERTDYILIIDADDKLVINNLDEWGSLTEDTYNLIIKRGIITYYRPQLIKSNLELNYIGILHEYLNVANNGIYLKNSYIDSSANGSRSQDPLKYQHDAETFIKALKDDPTNSRYLFYCAQSFRDAGEKAKALEYYLKRAEITGWVEEDYIALLEAGKLMAEIDIEKAENLYLTAHNKHGGRAEALCYLAKLFRAKNKFDKSYFYAVCASKIIKPESALFLEDACYDWIPIDEMAVSGFYIGKKTESIMLNKKLLEELDVPEYHKPRIKDNLKLCIKLVCQR